MSTEFAVTATRAGDVVVVTLSGEMDMGTSPVAEKTAVAAVLEPDVVRVALDMGGISFLDSTGLGALVRIRELAVGNGTTLVLRDLRPEITRLFDLVGLRTSFEIEPTRA